MLRVFSYSKLHSLNNSSRCFQQGRNIGPVRRIDAAVFKHYLALLVQNEVPAKLEDIFLCTMWHSPTKNQRHISREHPWPQELVPFCPSETEALVCISAGVRQDPEAPRPQLQILL